jgi:hypothetical protein
MGGVTPEKESNPILCKELGRVIREEIAVQPENAEFPIYVRLERLLNCKFVMPMQSKKALSPK